jgi:hypothetical protein
MSVDRNIAPAEFLRLIERLNPVQHADDRTQLVQSFGIDRMRRTVHAMAMPAAIPEVRRAVSTVAARHGVDIDPNIPGDRLVDEVLNYSPSKLALELFLLMKGGHHARGRAIRPRGLEGEKLD